MSIKPPADNFDKLETKAQRRERSSRPRMKVSGASLKQPQKFAGLSMVKRKKK